MIIFAIAVLALLGLVVLKALYGDLRNRGELSLPPASVIDVTMAVQCKKVSHSHGISAFKQSAEGLLFVFCVGMVQFSELVNESRTKMFIDGFYDPCPYRDKMLFIRYLFKGNVHQVCYDDKESIRIPMRRMSCCTEAQHH